MPRFIALVSIAITIYALVHCAQQEETKNLPKWGWILIILFAQLIGSIAYFIAGRPNGGRGYKRPRFRDVPPDDNPDFLRKL